MSGGHQAGRVHVVGAGLAGLAAAVELAASGYEVRLYEAAGQAGGRCRSYFDAGLGCRIDNGNHLVLSGNRDTLGYLGRIGSRDTIAGPTETVFPFFDAASGQRWALRPNPGAVPWWVLRPARRVPGSSTRDYLAVLGLRFVGAAATVAEVLRRDRPLFRRLWEPLAVAALNTGVERASARLFWHILAETLGRGGARCRPLLPREGLSETFVAPALETLRKAGAEIRFGARLRALALAADHVAGLVFETGTVALDRCDDLVLAVPAMIAARLVPDLTVPDAFSPIVNAHFRCPAPPGVPLLTGIVGGTAEWVFRKREVLSVTVSAADRLVDHPAETLRQMLWRDVAAACRLPPEPVPAARILKERRATFLASPEQLRRRPAAVTRWPNLVLAGDYTATGLPATIEGAIGSGLAASRVVAARRRAAAPLPAGVVHRRAAAV